VGKFVREKACVDPLTVGKVTQHASALAHELATRRLPMAKKARKRRSRRKNKANHGKRPLAGRK
jgi:hypothetical protein